MSDMPATKSEVIKKKTLVQQLDEFTLLFELEINISVKKELALCAKSDLTTLIMSMIAELLADGFISPPYGSERKSSDAKFGFWGIISKELQTESLSFILENSGLLQTSREQTCGWLLLELDQKSVSSTFEAIASNPSVMSYYQEGAVFKSLQSSILCLLKRLDSLNFSIQAEVIQAFRKYINERRKLAQEVTYDKAHQSCSKDNAGDPKNISRVNRNNENQMKTNFLKPKPPNIQIPDADEKIKASEGLRNEPAECKLLVTSPSYPNSTPTSAKDEPRKSGSLSEIQLELNRISPAPLETTEKGSVSLKAATNSAITPASKENQKPLQKHDIEKKPNFTRIKPSERLYEEKFKIEEELYVYRPQPSEIPDPSRQSYKCYFCTAPLSKFTLFFDKTYGYCDYTGHYYCNKCMSAEKMVIPWRVMKGFNFKRFAVSNEAQEELTKYMDKCNITIHPEDDIVQKNKTITETLYKKKELHLIFDTICEPPRAFDAIKNHRNLVLKQFLFSLKDLQQMQEGTLLKLIERIIGLLKKHISGCMECQKKGRVCKLCASTQKIFAFEVETTSFCKKCNLLYHSKCLRSIGCIVCVYKI